LPYERGYFYFVDTNSKLLAASGGKSSVDTIVLSLLNQRKSGTHLTPQSWLDPVEKELGAAGKHEFETEVVEGRIVVPPSNAFGPCFERQSVPMPIFQLGFEEHATLDSFPRVVRGIVSGSAAEGAGLRDGDRIVSVSPIDMDQLRSSLSKLIHLQIQRRNETIEIEYVPRSSQQADGYQWIRNSQVPDAKCAI
jgi:predicted metalloprotease with PDZ domain